MLKSRLVHVLAISAVYLLASRLTHAQTGGMVWSQFFAVGGPLESLSQSAPPIVCAEKGPLSFPVLHPKPVNVDGSAVTCYPGGLLRNQMPIQVAEPQPLVIYVNGEAEGLGAQTPSGTKTLLGDS